MAIVDRYGHALDADGIIGFYGPGEVSGYGEDYGIAYREGLLSEHVAEFAAAGGTVRPAASGSGRSWAVRSDGKAVPVVCGEMIWVTTEDGRQDGRCGADALDNGMCPPHAADYEAFLGLGEWGRVQADWEADARAGR